ncbi:hypothetical protein TNCV_1061071 [Trichonephila clavipes]|nr:hypothetical protein TNCV_1061071 [Trichonephila clavipes]
MTQSWHRSSSSFHATPTGGRSSLTYLTCSIFFGRRVFSGTGSNSWQASHVWITLTTRYHGRVKPLQWEDNESRQRSDVHQYSSNSGYSKVLEQNFMTREK